MVYGSYTELISICASQKQANGRSLNKKRAIYLLLIIREDNIVL